MVVRRPKKKFGAGESKYPVRAGAVFRLEKPVIRRNPKMGNARFPHWCFVWILNVSPIPKYKKPKHREVTICRLYPPTADDMRRFYLPRKRDGSPDRARFISTVAFSYVTDLMRSRGYRYVGHIPFKPGNKKTAFRRFYRMIRVL